MSNEEKKESLLPPPELLERYESVYKGVTKDLIKLVEKEQAHRHALQKKYLNHFRCGQFFGGIFLTSVIFSIYCLARDYHIEMAYMMSAMFGLLIVLILTQYRKDKNNAIMRKSMNNNRYNNNRRNNNSNNRRGPKKNS